MTELKVGDRVVVNGKCITSKLIGLTGTITKVNNYQSTMMLDGTCSHIKLSHYKFDLLKPKKKKGLAFFLEKHSL